ncbi:MAG: O-antigen ligase family protein [Elusimicrobiaceae bacterium]|nr:O-antigen ligase family protein [Elusimicrobiaceae bacterium]
MQNKILNFTEIFKGFCFTVCLFVCPLLFLTDTTQNPFAIQPLFLSIFGSGFVLCWGGEILLKREINFRYSKLDFIFIVFLFSLLLSLIFNYFFDNHQLALINEFLRKSDYLFFGLIFGFLFAKITVSKISFGDQSYKFFKNIFLWCLAWLLWKIQASFLVAILIFGSGTYLCFVYIKQYGIKEILDVMLATCFCACLYGLMQALGFELFWVLDISKEFGARSVSTFGNPNFLASFVLLFLPYSLLLFLQAKNKKGNLISGFITLVLALFLIISGTRSAWLGLLFCTVGFLFLCKELRKIFLNKFAKIFVLFLIFCVCSVAIISGLKNKGISTPGARISEVKQVFSLKTFSLQSKYLIQPLHQRLMMWHCALNNFKNSPIFGKGVNSFQLNFPYCQGKLIAKNPTLDKMNMQANDAHNEYLEILSDGGFISVAVYVCFWILLFAMFNKKIKTLSNEEKYFYFALIFGLISVLIDNLFNITLRTLLVGFAFWFISSSLNNLNTKSKRVSLRKSICWVISILICFIIYGLISFQTKYFIAQTYELKGYKNLVKGNYQATIDDMEKAIEISSFRPESYYVLINNYVAINEFKKAQNITEKVLKFYPAYYEFNYRLAALNYTRNKREEALENLRKTLSLLPTYTPAAELFANILSGQDSVSKEDKKLLENLIEILPYEPNLPSYLAEIYFKEKDFENATVFALKALRKNIFDKAALKIIIDCETDNTDDKFLEKVKIFNSLKDEIKTQQTGALLNDIKKLQVAYPDEPEAVSLLAEFDFKRGKFCEAMNALKHYKGNNFWNKSYNFSLSLSAQKCGDKQVSKDMLEEILYIDPYDELAKNRLKNVNILM